MRQEGVVLIVVLVILVLLATMVGEFVYEVYTLNSLTHNWKERESLTLIAESTAEAVLEEVTPLLATADYTNERFIQIPLYLPSEEEVEVIVEDEQARINLNRLIYPNGMDNRRMIALAKRLCKVVGVDDTVIDRFADWIDRDSVERLPGSEEGARNGPFYSPEELRYVRGVQEEALQRLLPFVTVYPDGTAEADRVNINTAPREVLLSLHPSITETMVDDIINHRASSPFQDVSEIKRVGGIEPLYPEISPLITVKSRFFKLKVVSKREGLTAEVVERVAISGGPRILFYRVI